MLEEKNANQTETGGSSHNHSQKSTNWDCDDDHDRWLMDRSPLHQQFLVVFRTMAVTIMNIINGTIFQYINNFVRKKMVNIDFNF